MTLEAEIGTPTHIGASYKGLTNTELALGKGVFVSDVELPGMAWAAILRSPHAHARILRIDTSAARALEGVLDVMTGEEARANMRPIPEAWNTREIGAKGVQWYPLTPDRVRYVGEAVAAVVAEDKYTAHKALGLIDVEYEELEAVTDPERAMEPDSALVEPEWGDNLLITRDWRAGDVEAALAAADRRTSGTVRSARITGVSLEPRGVIASWDRFTSKLTYWESTQNPHPLRTFLAETLGMPENDIRVIQPRVGGAFGLKQPPFQEEPLLAYLSRKLGRPVKWIEERDENFQATGHSRDVRFSYDVGFDDQGTVSAIDIRVVADVGAPTALLGWGQSFVTGYCLPACYKIPNARIRLSVMVTNKCPWNAYRGFGKDSASFLMDRVMDRVAREIGIDRAEVRLRNFIPSDEFPYPQPTGAVLDSGDYAGTMRKVLEMVDYAGFPRLQEQARRQGRRIGIGIGQELTPEGCAMPGAVMISAYDGSTVRVAPTGEVTVLTGVTSPGCGNETAIAQIAAEYLGCEFERVRVIQGDTDICPYGLGNYSSRATMYGGSATQKAAVELRQKLLRVAGKMLETDPEDLDARNGRILVKGAPGSSVSFDEVVNQIYRFPFREFAEDEEPGLESTRYFRMGNVYHQPEKQGRFSNYPAWPNGTAACVVEVDEETGHVKLVRYCLVDDTGRLINPMLVDANLHGGITQGIGGAMYESIAYGDDGQLHTATLMDYTIPTAVEVPMFEVGHQETPSPFTPLGMKGAGESGVGSALGALCGAIENAFPELDLELDELILTPNRVWEAIQAARRRQRTGTAP
jgi:aerobic carbon-monoxide dehydrogenase large subunit